MRENRYTVARPVMETAVQEETYTVQRPVYETAERDESYTVMKPVYETAYRTECHTVLQPVTTYRTQYVDQGCFHEQIGAEAGLARHAAGLAIGHLRRRSGHGPNRLSAGRPVLGADAARPI